MEQMICANAEKCGDNCHTPKHSTPHGKNDHCSALCSGDGHYCAAACIPYKPKDTAMEQCCETCRYSSDNNDTGRLCWNKNTERPRWTEVGGCVNNNFAGWQPIIKDTAMEKSCETCGLARQHNGTGRLCKDFNYCHGASNWQPIIKDTTMTVSYQDLKEKGACEKGLIWFWNTFGEESISIEVVKQKVLPNSHEIRDIYHADPDSWIKWLEEKYGEVDYRVRVIVEINTRIITDRIYPDLEHLRLGIPMLEKAVREASNQ